MRKMIQMLCFVVCGCLLLSFALPAQNYLPIVKENAEWTVLKIKGRTQPDPNFSISYDSSYIKTWIEGDTLIAGTQFKKVFHREFSPGPNVPVYQGAIREADQMVTWIPAVGENVGRLDTLYNFNVEVGDTIARYYHMGSFYDYVGKIDSITLQDGIKRKRIDIYRGPYTQQSPANTWIEGVGEIRFGLIYPFCSAFNPRCSDQFLCYKESENLVYESFPSACNSFESKPQALLPFPTKNAVWSEVSTVLSDFDPVFNNYHYAPVGDTIIQNQNYTKLYGSTGKAFKLDSAQYVGAYLNESNRIFFIDKGDLDPKVLYDFNVPIGWVLSTVFNCGDTSKVGCRYSQLTSIDTVMYDDYIKRRRYVFDWVSKRFDGTFDTLRIRGHYWIEGIGSTFGFFPDRMGTLFYPVTPYIVKDLLCFQQNDNLIYAHPLLYKGECYIDMLVDVKDLDDPHVVNIYPNPVVDQLFIQHDLNQNKSTSSVLLMDVMGRVVLQKPLDASLIQLDVANLSPGVYFIQIRSKEGRVSVLKKIIKIH